MYLSNNNRLRKNIVAISLVAILYALSSVIEVYWASAFIAALVFLILIYCTENDSVTHLLFYLGFVIFIFMPALVNGYFFETSFDLFFSTAIASILFLFWTKNLNYKKQNHNPREYLPAFFFFSFCLIIGSFLEISGIYFLGPLVMFYALCLDGNFKLRNYMLSLVFIVAFLIYYAYGWDGFGRTVVFSYLIAAVICYFQNSGIKINKIMLASVGTLGSLALISRKGDFSGLSLERSLEDSTIGPYRLASTFIDNPSIYGYDLNGFLDMVIFSFLSFVPRDVWPGKPFGFGFQYVVDNMGESFIDAGHSIASTLIADHFYYLGSLGFATGIFMLWLISLMMRWAYQVKIFDGYIYLIFASNMTVLVWGGVTSFSARVIYPMIALAPLIAYYFFKRKFK